MGQRPKRQFVGAINELVGIVRAGRRPIIWVRQEFEPDLSDAFPEKSYSAFFGTNLDEILRQMQPDSLVLSGINTHARIRTTAIDAYQRDLHVILASDCIGSYDREHHDISLKHMKDKIATLLTNEEIGGMLRGRNPQA